MEPTPEQAYAVELFGRGESVKLRAVAGAGKTSTLRMMAESAPESQMQFMAFNRAIVDDVKRVMPRNVRCQTNHSLAFGADGYRFRHRLDSKRMPSGVIASYLSVDPFSIPSSGVLSQRTLSSAFLASHAMKALVSFAHSPDDEPSVRHVHYIDGLDFPDDGHRTYANNDAVAEYLAPIMRDAWRDLTDPNGRLPYRHDFYLKSAQLKGFKIDADVILLDEAQDTDPVVVEILRQQTHAQIIAVGDENQSIYAWRGAVDALDALPMTREAQLTWAFRFGPEIADVANAILDQLDTDIRVVGKGSRGSVGRHEAPSCVLTRTNAAALSTVLSELDRERKVFLVGGGGEIESFAKAAARLIEGGRTEHYELACFDSWASVQAYVASDPQGDELKLMVGLIDDYGVDAVIRAVCATCPERSAEVVVSTAHKSKGRQWPVVQLAGDFPKDEKCGDADWRLLYVAATRAQEHLDYAAAQAVRSARGEDRVDVAPLASDPAVLGQLPRTATVLKYCDEHQSDKLDCFDRHHPEPTT